MNSFHPGSTRAPLLTPADLGLGQQREISAKKLIAIGGFPKLNSDDGFQLYKNKSVQRAPKNSFQQGDFLKSNINDGFQQHKGKPVQRAPKTSL